MTEDRHPAKRKIADDVEDFVPYKFILEAKRLRVQHSVGGERDGILKRSSASQTALMEHFQFLNEAEGSSRSYQFSIAAIDQHGFKLLTADEWVFEFYFAGDPEFITRLD